jgi:hypothetical protein
MGKLSISSPEAGEKLYVSKDKMVEWSTTGTINNVNISYSQDGGDSWESAAANITNSDYYIWTIPDIVLIDRSPNSNVYIKIEDSSDSDVYDTRQVTVSYYKVIWNVIDADGLVGDLDALGVVSLDVSDNNLVWEDRSGLACDGEINEVGVDDDDIELYYHPGHLYQTIWSRDAYLDTTYQPSPWTADQDGKEMTVKLATKQVLKQRTVYSEIDYNADNDNLKIQVWLQEEEKLLTETAGLQGCLVVIFDKDDNAIKTFDKDASEADSSGVFWLSWDNPDISEGEQYFARYRVQYQGAFHYGGESFSVSQEKKLKEVSDQVATGVVTITEAIEESKEEIKEKIETEVQTEAKTTREKVEETADETVTVLQGEEPKTLTEVSQEVSREASSRILNEKSFVKNGTEIAIRYQAPAGVSPLMSVYDPENTLVEEKSMTEVAGAEGIYQADIEFKWDVGVYTIVCSETTHGTIDGISIEVIRSELDDIYSAAVVSMGQLASIDTTKMSDLSANIAVVSDSIEGMVGTINDLSEISSMGDELSSLTENIKSTLFEELGAVSEKMKDISEKQGLKVDKILEVSESGQDNIDYIKNRTLEVKAMTEINKEILEKQAEQPITKSWLSPSR